MWAKSITAIGLKWLNHTPKIQVTDYNRLIFIDMLKGNYTNRAIQSWQEAALILGLSEYLKEHRDAKTIDAVNKFMNLKFNENGDWKEKPLHIDTAILSYSLMKLECISIDAYKKALDSTWELIKDHIGEDGIVQYRKFMKSYRYVDTIGFICPFLVTYGIKYNKSECIDLAVMQIQHYEQHGMLHNQYIPSHAYKLGNNTPQGLYGWGRGLGWFAIGLIDAWNELPDDHKYKIVLKESVYKFAKEVMAYQQENGNWNWIVTRNESRPDSSATATLAWFLMNASRIKGLSISCFESVDKAMKYLMTVTRRDGVVDFSQGDTKDIGVYSMNFNKMPFTQGFCIRGLYHYQSIKELGVQTYEDQEYTI